MELAVAYTQDYPRIWLSGWRGDQNLTEGANAPAGIRNKIIVNNSLDGYL
jgi:hypothetical protein